MIQKHFIMSALLASLACTSITIAQQADEGQAKQQRPRVEGRQRGPEGNMGNQAKRPEGQGRPAGQLGMRDPAQMVAMMMQRFDSDGDQKLNAEELAALLSFMRERQGGAMGGPNGGPRGIGNRARPGDAGNRLNSPGGSSEDSAGGVKPRRPPSE